MPVADLIIREEMPLAPLTTLGVGGPARYFMRAESGAQVEAAARWATDAACRCWCWGGGATLWWPTPASPAWCCRWLSRVSERARTARSWRLPRGPAWSGARWSHGRWRSSGPGSKCLAGVPGFVGATPVQNVGAYGQEVRETISRVEAFDLQTRQMVSFTNETCQFGYRDSRFKNADHGRYIILAVSYRLIENGPPTVHYIELERTLAAREIAQPSLHDVWRAVLDIRRRKSMLLNPHDPNARSVGSFFINPLLSEAQMTALDAAIAAQLPPGEHIPRFSALGGGFKVPAAWLIEHSGFARGHGDGPVGLSGNHSLAIINRGGATARNVLVLARRIRDGVFARFGVTLLPEPILVGVRMDEG